MSFFKSIAIAILLLSFAVFVALFGRLPSFRKTPIGILHRFVCITLPDVFAVVDVFIAGGKGGSSLAQFAYYINHKNHPIVLVLFLFIVSASQAIFIPSALRKLDKIHRLPVAVVSVLPYVFTYKAVRSTASFVTDTNHSDVINQYPYDDILYQRQQACSTCKFTKPARSKHCRICSACVAKHDHHCVWVMNCLGKGNYAYFLGLLASLGSMLSYGAILGYNILNKELQEVHFELSHPQSAKSSWSDGLTWVEYFTSWSWIVSRDYRIGSVGMLALLTAPLAWGMFCFHVYLIWAGMTTNESSKWADWRDDISDGLVYKKLKCEAADEQQQHKWPIWTTHSFARHAESDKPTFLDAARGWNRVQNISELENLYDLGFWENMRDVLPNSWNLT